MPSFYHPFVFSQSHLMQRIRDLSIKMCLQKPFHALCFTFITNTHFRGTENDTENRKLNVPCATTSIIHCRGNIIVITKRESR